jgi:hypothetical protein
MRRVAALSFLALIALIGAIPAGAQSAADIASRVQQMELGGDSNGARLLLESSLKRSPRDQNSLRQYAEFLDRHGDSGARAAYQDLLTELDGSGSADLKLATARRLAVLDLMAGDRAAAETHLAQYRSAGGAQLAFGSASRSAQMMGVISIPGPYRSFARMAALSPDLPPQEILPALSRNIITNGYQSMSGAESVEQTEYLKLVIRYLSQARELEKLAGSDKMIRIETCDSAQTGDLLKILGFRMRGACGSDVVLETVNATRAFLSMDSGFPLAVLETSLRTNRPFTYDYSPAQIPILYGGDSWVTVQDKGGAGFIDGFIADPLLCRLYLGMWKLDPETADGLHKELTLQRIRAFAHVFDFFGGMFRIREGTADVPGGAAAVPGWTDLAGISPTHGAQFLERIVTKDDGWLASYFDCLMRIQGPTLDYLSEPARLKRFYAALRGRVTSPGPARPVFRANTDLMLLTTRLRLDPDGHPHIPGGLDVWKRLFAGQPAGKMDVKLSKSAPGWRDPDDVIEALFGLSRKAVENDTLKIFLATSDMDRRRAQPLAPATVERLAKAWSGYSSQFPLLNESPAISDHTILLYLDTASAISDQKDSVLKADTAGLMQSLAGLWQIGVRRQVIPDSKADATLAKVIEPFADVKTPRDQFDAARAGLVEILAATGAPPNSPIQDRLLELLAGAIGPSDSDTEQTILAEMNRGFEAQRLIPLKTLFELSDLLESASKGEKPNTELITKLSARLFDLGLPRNTLTAPEKTSVAFGYYSDKHVDAERKMNFRAAVDKAAASADRYRELRGLLTPHLRDTLVGLLYLHYSPPGSQIIYTNPLFVRSHDFIGSQNAHLTWSPTEVLGLGWPSNGGGRLTGSLGNLPFALAEAEQNFLIPSREQALIWGDLVPQLLVSSKLPRWWNVTPDQMHWVALHMRAGASMIAESALNPDLRRRSMSVLDALAPPQRVQKVSDLLQVGDVKIALELVTPAELYQLGLSAVAGNTDLSGSSVAQIRALAAQQPAHVNSDAISAAFGTPKPNLANTYHPELMNLRTFPTLMGFSSRIMAESWESNNLYFAALADELGYSPSQLNVLIPEWTQKTVEQIFATHLEDWPALLRSMRSVGDQAREQARKLRALETRAALN